jgi:hypothetical protein
MTTHHIHRLVAVGFCQPKFYKSSVWRAAKKLMDEVVCPNKLATPFDFGRGKGKYNSNLDIDEVKKKTVEVLASQNRVDHQKGYILVANTTKQSNRPVEHNHIKVLPDRVINYRSYDETVCTATVFADKHPLNDGVSQWVSVDDFICQCFVIDVEL